jgi:hypothetical protein
MKVDRVSVSIRYSKDIQGAWKTIETGAEASLDEAEDWVIAQQGLYAMLSAQMRELYQQGQQPQHAHNGSEKAVEGSNWQELTQPPPQ